MYYKSWILDQKWRPFSSIGTGQLVYTPRVVSMWCGQLNMHSSVTPSGPTYKFLLGPQTLHCDCDDIFKSLFSARGQFYKYKTSMDQIFKIERVIIDLVCCSRCPVSTSTRMVYGGNVFWSIRGFSLQLMYDLVISWVQLPFKVRQW